MFEMENIYKTFGIGSFKNKKTVYALNDVNLHIKEREILGLVGESGSGKTTIARTIARIYQPTDGIMKIDGDSVPAKMKKDELIKYRKKVQMIFQDPFSSLNPLHTVGYILSRPYLVHGLCDKKEVRERVISQLERIGLTPADKVYEKLPYELSGGQRQRIGIARALAVKPRLVLADEPTSMLDVSIRLDIMNLLIDLKEEEQVSILFITHDLAGARYMSDRLAIMYAGFIVEFGNADEVIDNPRHPYTKLLKKAAPKPESGLIPEDIHEEGGIPNLTDRPVCCPFEPRCEMKKGICSQSVPKLKDIGDGSMVRCFLYGAD